METNDLDRSIPINVSMPMSAWAAVDQYGKQHGLNRSEAIRRAVELLLNPSKPARNTRAAKSA